MVDESIIKITNSGYSSCCGVVAVEKTVVHCMGTNKKIEAGKCEVLLSSNHYQTILKIRESHGIEVGLSR